MTQNWPFTGLVPGSYRMVMLDPPWALSYRSSKGMDRAAEAHYRCMSADEILALPVADLAGPGGCWFWLWATAPMYDLARDCFRSWGITYSTQGTWVKTTKDNRGPTFGTGHVLRNAHEPFLIGKIARPAVCSRSVRSVIMAPRRAHSQKPEEAYRDAALLAGPGRYADVFSRQSRPGWESWGDEAGKFDVAA